MSEITNFINIRKSSKSNFGGICTFWFVPVEEVASIPYHISGNIPSAIQLVEGASWRVGYSTQGSLSFETTTTRDNRGISHKVNLSGIAPKIDPVQTKNFRFMTTKRFLVIFKDRNGSFRLLGTKTNGVRFQYMESIPGTFSSYNGYSITFYGEYGCPPHFYLDGIEKTESEDSPPVPV
jgi:hypothetical protein